MSIWTRAFWAATAERAVKSLAQGMVAVVGIEMAADGTVSAAAVDWMLALWVGLGTAALSVLTSVATNTATGDGPSLIRAETVHAVGRHPAEGESRGG